MKIYFSALILAVVSWPALSQPRLRAVDVYISERDGSCDILGRSTPLVSAMFGKIGIRLNWRRGRPPLNRSAIAIRTAMSAPDSAMPEALAASDLLDSPVMEIAVYRDRLRRFLDAHPSLAGVATGYVLAHELAHVMQGVARHSDSGIMKAYWSNEDFQEMRFHKLSFSAVDVEMIHEGLALRLAGAGGETMGSVKTGGLAPLIH